jgi:aspartate-semialdehyde dehydrogenase
MVTIFFSPHPPIGALYHLKSTPLLGAGGQIIMKIAVVGATGLVGSEILKVLEERNFPITELIPVASERSVGKQVTFKGKQYTIVSFEDAIAAKPAIAIFSAGGGTSLSLAPKFAEAGITVVDNSSAWRMDPTKKLVVPEINAFTLTKEDKIIANPNCSTIQMVVVLNPLHKRYGIKRVVVSTYQSVTGTGKAAVDQLLLNVLEIKTLQRFILTLSTLTYCLTSTFSWITVIPKKK